MYYDSAEQYAQACVAGDWRGIEIVPIAVVLYFAFRLWRIRRKK